MVTPDGIEVPDEIDVTLLCERYGSGMPTLPTELAETLIEPTTLPDGRTAIFAFRYGTKKYKVTFEQVDRLRMPKEAKNGGGD